MNKTNQNLPAFRSKLVAFRFSLLAILTMVTACAGQIPVQPVADGTLIQVNTPESNLRNPNARAGGAVGKGAAKGAGMGAGAGVATGIVGSMACGPFFFFCAPVLVGGGAVIGVAVGATAGTVVGATLALPKEKADALDVIIEDFFEDTSHSQALRGEFEKQGGDYWTISADDGDVEITLVLNSFFIEQFKGHNLALRMSSTMIVRYGPDKDQTADEVEITYNGSRKHIDDFLKNDGENFRIEVRDAFAYNVGQMVAALHAGNSPHTNYVATNGKK